MSGRIALISIVLLALFWTIFASLSTLRTIRLECEGDQSNNALCVKFPITSDIIYWIVFGISITLTIVFVWAFINFAGRLRGDIRDSLS